MPWISLIPPRDKDQEWHDERHNVLVGSGSRNGLSGSSTLRSAVYSEVNSVLQEPNQEAENEYGSCMAGQRSGRNIETQTQGKEDASVQLPTAASM